MQSGPEQFREWMRKRGFTQADATRYLGWDDPYVSKLLNKGSLGLDNALHLERLTGIPVEAWESSVLDESEPVPAGQTRKRQYSQGNNA